MYNNHNKLDNMLKRHDSVSKFFAVVRCRYRRKSGCYQKVLSMGKILNQTPTMGMARKTGVAKDWVMYPQQLMLHRNFCMMGISRRNHQLRRLNQICMPPLHHLQE